MAKKTVKERPVCDCSTNEMTYLSEAAGNRGSIYHCKQHGQIKVICTPQHMNEINRIERM